MGDHWKNYEPIEGAVVFDERGNGPSLGRVQVIANCSPNENYPTCRVVIGIAGAISASLTREQSAELRALLLRAENDVEAVLLAREMLS